jgi:uncharacterized protein
MDFSEDWWEFLSRSREIEGGALMTVDGVLITSAKFGSSETEETLWTHCAAFVAIARQFTEYTERGEFDALILEGKHGYIILMPVIDKTIFAVLARKQAKLGLVLLDMRGAIHGPFGPGLAREPIVLPRPPKHGGAHAIPEQD